MSQQPLKIVVTGILFFYPMAGVTYQFLHYLLGLKALGHDVVYIEDSSRWVYDPRLHDVTKDATDNVKRVVPSLEKHGFKDRWAYRNGGYESCTLGMSDMEIDQWYKDADILLNVTGSQEMLPKLLEIPVRAYIESDPFMVQVDIVNGVEKIRTLLDGHTHHFTFGENIGTANCTIPETPYDWHTTRQAVFMDLWQSPKVGKEGYRTITTWRNKGKDRVYKGETYYWTKHIEFERYIDLPSHRPVTFELAVSNGDEALPLLAENGWRTRPGLEVSNSLESYRDFIVNSTAEFTVARDQYVRPNTGWFSDRSASYLAAGRPVITQETGFSDHLPSGRGLFGFSNKDEVLAAIDAIESDPIGHSEAAREIGREYFATDRILPPLLDTLQS